LEHLHRLYRLSVLNPKTWNSKCSKMCNCSRPNQCSRSFGFWMLLPCRTDRRERELESDNSSDTVLARG
jgi:hypothetical protein